MLESGNRAFHALAFSLCLAVPWALGFMLVMVPLSAWLDPISGSASAPIQPSHVPWLAMGVFYFSIAGFARWWMVRLTAAD
jgi:hypothetical protein